MFIGRHHPTIPLRQERHVKLNSQGTLRSSGAPSFIKNVRL
jgi:hypothetical protein